MFVFTGKCIKEIERIRGDGIVTASFSSESRNISLGIGMTPNFNSMYIGIKAICILKEQSGVLSLE